MPASSAAAAYLSVRPCSGGHVPDGWHRNDGSHRQSWWLIPRNGIGADMTARLQGLHISLQVGWGS